MWISKAGLATATCLLVIIAAGGCASSLRGADIDAQLQGTCQFRACVCKPDTSSIWATGSADRVRWGEDGIPYCPPGESLHLAR